MINHIEKYAEQYGRDPLNNFAVACYEQNTLEELEYAGAPDAVDMREWGIDRIEWCDAIDAAVAQMRADVES